MSFRSNDNAIDEIVATCNGDLRGAVRALLLINEHLEAELARAYAAAADQGLAERGHRVEVINDSYQDFGAGQFIWRAGDPKVQGYVAASDARRDGQAVGF